MNSDTMTLEQARKLQKNKETKSIAFFLGSIVIIGLLTALIFGYEKDTRSYYWLFPIITLMIAVRATGIYCFLNRKELIGRVVHVHIYSLRERSRKGLNYGTGANSKPRRQEAEIIVEDSEGRSVMLTVKHRDTVAKLSEGDKVAVLRFLDTPVIIEDLGKERSY